jgi:hypothetical protein
MFVFLFLFAMFQFLCQAYHTMKPNFYGSARAPKLMYRVTQNTENTAKEVTGMKSYRYDRTNDDETSSRRSSHHNSQLTTKTKDPQIQMQNNP